MCFALIVGAFIILKNMAVGLRAEKMDAAKAAAA